MYHYRVEGKYRWSLTTRGLTVMNLNTRGKWWWAWSTLLQFSDDPIYWLFRSAEQLDSLEELMAQFPADRVYKVKEKYHV